MMADQACFPWPIISLDNINGERHWGETQGLCDAKSRPFPMADHPPRGSDGTKVLEEPRDCVIAASHWGQRGIYPVGTL